MQIAPEDFYEFFDEFPHALESIENILESFKTDIFFLDDISGDPLNFEENQIRLAEIFNPSIENFNYLLANLNFHVEPIDVDIEEHYKGFFDEKNKKEFEQIQKMQRNELKDERNLIDFMFDDLED